MSTATATQFDISAAVNRKPSIAVRAAIHGLSNRRNDPKFVLHMSTWGGVNDGLCMGCMATVSLEAITNTQLTAASIWTTNGRASACNASAIDSNAFETAMNTLRCNNCYTLYQYCGLPSHDSRNLPMTLSSYGVDEYLLDGKPSNEQLDKAIEVLTRFANDLEARGF